MGQIFDHLGSLILVILTFTDQDNKHITVFLRVFFFISLISMNYITPISPIIFLIYPPKKTLINNGILEINNG